MRIFPLSVLTLLVTNLAFIAQGVRAQNSTPPLLYPITNIKEIDSSELDGLSLEDLSETSSDAPPEAEEEKNNEAQSSKKSVEGKKKSQEKLNKNIDEDIPDGALEISQTKVRLIRARFRRGELRE